MMTAWMIAGAALAVPAPAPAATVIEAPEATVEAPAAAGASAAMPRGIPSQLDRDQRETYAAVFAAIRDGRWTDAQLQLDAMKPGPLHAVARAEMFTAKGSPKTELEPLVALLNEAPELPQAEALMRLARARGAAELPPLPAQQRLVWQDGAPRRVRAKSVKADEIAANLALAMQPFVKTDDGVGAAALLDATEGLSPEALTEWQAKVAWMFYLSGDDGRARELAGKAAEGAGDWATQGRWMGSLAGWRAGDCGAAGTGFEGVAARAADADFRAAGLYWAARADMMCGRPDRIEARLKAAAQYRESFYGQLARQALGLKERAQPATPVGADWARLDARPNVRVAAALVEAGETELADKVIRQQARIGAPAEFGSLVRLAEQLDLPATSVWLAHNCPSGVTAEVAARYPTPNWSPKSGWRVDRSLVYAHTLEESGFRRTVESQAGAYGLMQIRAALATDFGREQGTVVDKKALAAPATNMDVGQRYLERLRDMSQTTGGLLPKVIAAYNAGPKPVGEWNAVVRDGGDPLLYIESIPYWETRGYVTTVLRNYWMYEAQGGKARSASRSALAQGMWPRFPGMAGATAVRLDARPNATASASVAGASAGGGLN